VRQNPNVDRARRHFYGISIVVLGAWEAAALAGRAPTITSTARRHRWLRFVWAPFLIGVARHLHREEPS